MASCRFVRESSRIVSHVEATVTMASVNGTVHAPSATRLTFADARIESNSAVSTLLPHFCSCTPSGLYNVASGAKRRLCVASFIKLLALYGHSPPRDLGTAGWCQSQRSVAQS